MWRCIACTSSTSGGLETSPTATWVNRSAEKVKRESSAAGDGT